VYCVCSLTSFRQTLHLQLSATVALAIMADRVCGECGSKVARMYVVCDVCGERMAPEETNKDNKDENSSGWRVDSHPGYEVRNIDDVPTATATTEEEARAAASTVWCTVLGRTGGARARIVGDGTVMLLDGRVLGFINEELQVVRFYCGQCFLFDSFCAGVA
jgi:hypothetical protein